MTTQKAIHMLYSLKLMKEDDISDLTGIWYKGIKEDYDEALNMAIKALSCSEKPNESENPCENCQEFDCYVCEWWRRKNDAF